MSPGVARGKVRVGQAHAIGRRHAQPVRQDVGLAGQRPLVAHSMATGDSGLPVAPTMGRALATNMNS